MSSALGIAEFCPQKQREKPSNLGWKPKERRKRHICRYCNWSIFG